MKFSLYTSLFLLCLAACGTEAHIDTIDRATSSLQKGMLIMDLGEAELKVRSAWSEESPASFLIMNGAEEIALQQEESLGDTLCYRFPYYDSYLFLWEKEGQMHGHWQNKSRDADYVIPFILEKETRFCTQEEHSIMPAERFEVHFSPDSPDDHYAAIGLFASSGSRVTGTFVTETGDYRYLEGGLCGQELQLSCFDGAHAFHFTALMQGDSLVDGRFYSGIHWTEDWYGSSNDSFLIGDPDGLTHVVDSSALWETSMVDRSGVLKTLAEIHQPGRVSIIQVLGTWCPNCLDESMFYKELYEQHHAEGLDIIPLAFEASSNAEEAYDIINFYEEDLDLPYRIHYAGPRSKTAASEAFRSLNHIMSFPTSIYIDREGQIRRVHTGFYGPGTGILYERYSADTQMFVADLLQE